MLQTPLAICLQDLRSGWRRSEDLLRIASLKIRRGERVFVAARALIGRPQLVLADEPTSALDADTRQRFLELLLGECAKREAALLFVSHDASLAPALDRTLHMHDLNRV